MLTLTLQTSDRNNQVAIWDRNQSLVQTDFKKFSENEFSPEVSDLKTPDARVQKPGGSTLLLSMVQHCLNIIDATTRDIGLIGVTKGPGMFTPLRAGVVAAKTLSYVNQTPLVGVDVLEAIAIDAAKRRGLLVGHSIESVVNAQRKQLFAARFTVIDQGRVVPAGQSRLITASHWAEALSGDVVISGPGLKIIDESTLKGLSSRSDVEVESPEHWGCESTAVADIAQYRFKQNDTDDAWTLSPIYFRPSAAEEVRNQQNQPS